MLLAFAHGTVLKVTGFTCLAAIGANFAFTANLNSLIDLTPRALTGEATGMNTVLVRIGMALGSQLSGTVLVASTVKATGLPGDSGYTRSFLVAGLLAVVPVGLALLLPTRRRRTASAPALAASETPQVDPRP